MKNKSNLKENTLKYHKLNNKPGKIGVIVTKPSETQKNLTYAYTPGVAEVSIEIDDKPEKSFDYTNRGNLVAILSNGSAILGLGDLGPEPAYPVMEGKSLLFKQFGDVDSFPICINGRDDKSKTNSKKIIEIAKEIHYIFGGINLEDIKAPECFEIEETLKRLLDIPIFHDDQHGTAIITLAALFNTLKLTGKKIEKIKCVVIGAGAAGIATSKIFASAGVKKQNIILLDSKGIIYKNRKNGMNPYKKEFAQETNKRSLNEAIDGADVFVGVSAKNVLKPEMVKKMNKKSAIFAMANPWPEIMPEDAKKAGAFIIGTGRSDYPNQVNNVLGFPGIFRGVLDVQAKNINTQMKIAAAKALAEITNEKIPKEILKYFKKAYKKDYENGIFNGKNPLKPDYIIPKPLDPRVVPRVARKVAEIAVKEGSARKTIKDFDDYEKKVAERIKKTQKINRLCQKGE